MIGHRAADDTAANDDQVLGNFRQFQGLRGGNDALLVEGGKGQFNGLRARGDDDVFGGDFGRFFASHRDGVRILKTADTMVHFNVVFLHQEVNALAGDVDDGLLSGNHLFHIDHWGGAVDAVLCKTVNGVVVMFGRIQKRFGRNAAHIQAGSTQG